MGAPDVLLSWPLGIFFSFRFDFKSFYLFCGTQEMQIICCVVSDILTDNYLNNPAAYVYNIPLTFRDSERKWIDCLG